LNFRNFCKLYFQIAPRYYSITHCRKKSHPTSSEMKCLYLSPLPLAKDNAVFSVPHKNPKQTQTLSLAVPRQPSNDLFEVFEIERGVSADDEAKDDPG
jgi:hypothetical protein